MSESEFIAGWPKERGLFKCLVDGKEKYLVHHMCDITGRHWWSDTAGYDVVGCQIRHSKEKVDISDL